MLMLGAIGVVYGDIGTSPLYAMKESFIGPHPLAVDRLHIFGVLSLIFWSLMMIVTIKYVFVAMRADNRGRAGRLPSSRCSCGISTGAARLSSRCSACSPPRCSMAMPCLRRRSRCSRRSKG